MDSTYDDFNSIGAGFLPRIDTDVGPNTGLDDPFSYNENDFNTTPLLGTPGEDHSYNISPGPYSTLTSNPQPTLPYGFGPLSYTPTPPISEHNHQGYNNFLADQLGQSDVAQQQQQRAQMVPGWQDSTYIIGERTSQVPQQFSGLSPIYQPPINFPTPAQTTRGDNYDCSDFVRNEREGIRITALETNNDLRFDIITKVTTQGYGIQEVVFDNLSGLRALQAALADEKNGQGPTLQQLMVIGADNLTGKSQSAKDLWAILRRFGTRTNTNYRLAVLNGGSSSPDTYEILVLDNGNPAAKTIWLFTDDVDSISPDYAHRWSAITRPNTDNNYTPQSYASVAAAPVVDPSLLHANYTIPLRPSPRVVPSESQPRPQEMQHRAPRNPHRRGIKGANRPLPEPGNGTYMCTHCKKLCKDLNTLNHHERNHREKTLICDYCQKRFLWPKDLQRHLPMHTKEKKYTCHALDCGKKFTRKDNLRRHYINDHPELPPPSGMSQSSSQR